jgi:hypothetical protein
VYNLSVLELEVRKGPQLTLGMDDCKPVVRRGAGARSNLGKEEPGERRRRRVLVVHCISGRGLGRDASFHAKGTKPANLARYCSGLWTQTRFGR